LNLVSEQIFINIILLGGVGGRDTMYTHVSKCKNHKMKGKRKKKILLLPKI
jgi:hypothetical protein